LKKTYTLTEDDLIELNQLSAALNMMEVKGAENVFRLAGALKLIQGLFSRINETLDKIDPESKEKDEKQ